MKKRIALFLASLLMLSLLPLAAFADADFWDVAPEHWAYANIQTLVNEGTVSGYGDGSFRPGGTVTRAEFVKMIGQGPNRYLTDFTDVSSEHWAYDYIMYSGLVPQGTTEFLPDQPITRVEVAELLWKRAGSPSGFTAPSILTDGAGSTSRKTAVAWAYGCGIMNGDDGIHLRLADNMSRAEGAALILRAREKSAAAASISFAVGADEGILRQIFESLNLFDDPTYSPDKTLTYGELARAVVRLAGNEYEPSYFSLPSVTPFEHKYARDLDVLGRNVIGEDKVTAAVIDSGATVGDVIAGFTFAALHRSAIPYPAADTTAAYDGAMNTSKNQLLTFAVSRGIQLDTQNSLESFGRAATLRDVAATLVQLNAFIGLETDYSTARNMLGSAKQNHALDISGRYFDGYQLTLASIPDAVYAAPFVGADGSAVTPEGAYRFTQSFSSIFSVSLAVYKDALAEKGLNCDIVFYPSLTADNGNGYTMRVKLTVNSASGDGAVGSYFLCGDRVDPAYVLEAGKTLYVDIASGARLSGTTLDDELMYLDQIVCEG